MRTRFDLVVSAKWLSVCILLAVQFLLALGAKPKTERWIYSVSLWTFALIGYYVLACARDVDLEEVKLTLSTAVLSS